MAFSYSRRDIVVAACSASLVILAQPGIAAPMSFKVDLSGAQQVPPVQTGATGKADLTYDPATRVLTWNVSYSGLSGPATMAHFHGPAMQGKNGPPVIWLSEKGAAVSDPIKGQATLTPEQSQQLVTRIAAYSAIRRLSGHWQLRRECQCNQTHLPRIKGRSRVFHLSATLPTASEPVSSQTTQCRTQTLAIVRCPRTAR